MHDIYRYRLNEEKAEWMIYVTDVGQQQHFDMVFKVRIGCSMPFGLHALLCFVCVSLVFCHLIF